MDERLTANRENWDDRTGIHLTSGFYDLEAWLRTGGCPARSRWPRSATCPGSASCTSSAISGSTTLEWARTGARVTGLDFSPAAIDAARDIAQRAGLSEQSEFVCANVFDAVEALDHATFDVVYVSLGALCWLPSIDRWAEQVAALVAPGGRFYIHDVHPLAWAMADDSYAIEHSYFEEQDDPYVDESDRTYTDADRPLVHRLSFQWNHSIG